MDYLPLTGNDALAGTDYDLLILHHPPLEEPDIPCYVIHSNWDIITGGACDALADCLGILTEGPLDPATHLGRTGRLRNGPVPLSRFVRDVSIRLHVCDLRVVNFQPDRMVWHIGIVSGFGLEPGLIRTACDCGVDLYLSGDLTHKGAILGKNLGMVLVDAPHHATEVPGLFRLGDLIRELGIEVRVHDRGVPWKSCTLNGGF